MHPTLYRFREKKFVKLAWVGWSGHFLEDLSEVDVTEIRKKYLENDCYPVFIPKDMLARYSYYI